MRLGVCAFAVAAVAAVGLQVVAALTATHADLPQAVADGFHAQRSGNIVLRSVHHKATDAVATLIDDSHYYFASSAEADVVPRSLPLQNVADVRARSLGLATPNPHAATQFVHNDLFRRPLANVLLSVESLGEESVSTYGLERVRAVLNRYPTMSLHDESYPPSPVSTAATLATGATPSEHGIVGGAWKQNGKTLHAYASPSSWSQRATTADVLAQTFDGQPLLLSVSADAQHANAFGVNPTLDARLTRNAVNVALKDGAFRPLQNAATFSDAFASKQSDLLNALSSTGLFSGSASNGVSVDVRELQEPTRRVTVRYPATGVSGAARTASVTFDLHHREEAVFFSELMYVESLASVLRTHKLSTVVGDTVPDLLTVSLTGLTAIIEKHGRSSPQAVAAMHLLDVAVPQLLEQLNSVYGDRAVSQLVLLGSHRSFADAVDPRDVFATVARLLPSQDIKQFYPQVYVESGASVADVCRVLSTELDKLQFDVYCPQPTAATHMAATALFQLSESTVFATTLKATNTTGGSSVFRYQIVLWLSIVLALFVLGATYSLAWMAFKKDTLLYSTFNPNWEQRKRS